MDTIVCFTVIPSNVSILIFQFVIVVVNTITLKPWYDKLCKEKRNQFNMTRLSYNRVKSGANKNTMNIKAKEYRKTLNTSYQISCNCVFINLT
jgi:hypothetical protein